MQILNLGMPEGSGLISLTLVFDVYFLFYFFTATGDFHYAVYQPNLITYWDTNKNWLIINAKTPHQGLEIRVIYRTLKKKYKLNEIGHYSHKEGNKTNQKILWSVQIGFKQDS